MVANIKALEVGGTIDEQRQLHLDEPLPVDGPSRVRVIILLAEQPDDLEDRQWLRAGASNSAFAFLADPEEDVYTLADGKPFHD